LLIVNAHDWRPEVLGSESHDLCVLRLRRDELEALPNTWESLTEHAARIVLVMMDLDRYDQAGLDRYESVLVDIRQRLAAMYLRGVRTELSAISDRLGLDAPAECGAGLSHLTVNPVGDLYICPGFALDREPSVGNIIEGWRIPNEHLLQRRCAPICDSCDAFHCRRCVYMNRRATLEINTPAWQVCRAAHLERESSQVMLSWLHQRRCMENIKPIAPLDYVDPLDKLMQVRHGIPRGSSAVPRRAGREADVVRPMAEAVQSTARAQAEPHGRVGSVTPEERDEIRELYRRKLGLSCLVSTLARMDGETLKSTPLYERVVRDMGETTIRFDDWWKQMAAKYRWRTERPDQSWHVDFATCDILLD
jgi:CXXX repeat modification system protein